MTRQLGLSGLTMWLAVACSSVSSSDAADDAMASLGVQDDHALDAKPPFEADGEPIVAPERTWTWVPFDDTRCRDGSLAGLSVNVVTGSQQVMLYLEGGGACFDSQTCAKNPDHISEPIPSEVGVFDRSRDDNPVKDWSYVYVPYCTGDVHSGALPDGEVAGVPGKQQFVGRLNLEAFLRRLIPTFADAEQVLFTGVSAGGFGVSMNAAFARWAFGATPVTVIDDSGPLFSKQYLPACLTDAYRETWGLDRGLLKDCGRACQDPDYISKLADYTAKHNRDSANALIESDQDFTIRAFFGVGSNDGADDCRGTLGVTLLPAHEFVAGLLDYRARVRPYSHYNTFYPESTQHTWLHDASFYDLSLGDLKLTAFVAGVLAGEPAVHAGH